MSIDKKINQKKIKKKINIDLAVLPSHDTISLLSFLIPRNSPTTYNMGQPCCPFCHFHLLLFIFLLPNFHLLP